VRTLFIGSSRRGYLTLKAMIEASVPVVGILSLGQEPHEIERYEEQFRQIAAEKEIPLRETRLLKNQDLVHWIVNEIQPEAAFAVGVRVLMPEALWTACPQGCWAAHDSLLPAYRGFAPLNWSIINGETETGVTLFKVDGGMDTGDILFQQRIQIGPDETAPQVYEKLCAATVTAVLEGFYLLKSNQARPRPQEHSLATYTCSRTPADSMIDWHQSTSSIHNLIRALTFPYPGAFTYHKNKKLFICSAAPVSSPRFVGRIPGRVIQLDQAGWVDVLTGDGVLRIFAVSSDGQTRQDAAGIIRSVRARLGIDWSEAMAAIQQRHPASNL